MSAVADQPELAGPSPDEVARFMRDIAQDLGARYEVKSYLGRGAFATVWKAHDLITQEAVAVKRLDGRLDRGRGFYRELSVLFRLDHDSVVRIINLLEVERARYLFLEYCPGGSLRAALAKAQRAGLRCPPERVRALAIQLADGLAAAHRLGLVHRDLKPENVLFEWAEDRPFNGEARVKLADFGLSRALQRAGKGAATDGALAGLSGSPAYMAPEQFAGAFEPASDLYSLGVILFELLSGRRPFEGAPAELAWKHLNQPPEIDPGLPSPWPDLLACLLAKAPDRRGQRAETVLERLGQSPRRPAGPEGRASPASFAHCLGVSAFTLLPQQNDQGRCDFAAVSPEGLFRFRSDTGSLAGVTPVAGLTGAAAGDNGTLWLFQERKVLRANRPNQIEEVVTAPAPVEALAPPALGDVAETAALIAGHALYTFRPGVARSLRRVGPFGLGKEAPATLARLPDGGLALCDGPPSPSLLLLTSAGEKRAEVPLPGPCWQLGYWPGTGSLFASLRVNGELAAYRFGLEAGEVHRLDDSEGLAFLAAERTGQGVLYGLLQSGQVIRWLPTGEAEPLLNFGVSGVSYLGLATDGARFAALGRAREACWIYVRGEGRAW